MSLNLFKRLKESGMKLTESWPRLPAYIQHENVFYRLDGPNSLEIVSLIPGERFVKYRTYLCATYLYRKFIKGQLKHTGFKEIAPEIYTEAKNKAA